MTKTNIEIIKISLLVAFGSYLGWLNFTAINELIPKISETEPMLRLLFGLGGIWLLVKFGLKKQG